jgi:hypothetical protein
VVSSELEFYPEEGSGMFFRNSGIYHQYYLTSQLKKPKPASKCILRHLSENSLLPQILGALANLRLSVSFCASVRLSLLPLDGFS